MRTRLVTPGDQNPGYLKRTPATCIRQITRIRELVGITHFNRSFWFGDLAQARVQRSMELFARGEEVKPSDSDQPEE
jgi:hypothetical protein